MGDARDTLMLAFDRGLAEMPDAGRTWLFLNAAPLPAGAAEIRAFLECEQGFRPDFVRLEAAGYKVAARLEEPAGFAGAMVLLSRARIMNEAMLERAWNGVAPGGTILVAGANNDGVKSLRKWVSRRAGAGESLVKHHAGVFAIARVEGASPFQPSPPPRKGRHAIAPGMFSADGPDEGSQLLAGHFGERIAGRVADFGAGWGYLGTQLLALCPHITRLDSFEADFASLEAARINLAAMRTSGAHDDDDLDDDDLDDADWEAEGWEPVGEEGEESPDALAGEARIDDAGDDPEAESAEADGEGQEAGIPFGFHWCDLTLEGPKRSHDWIVMNPPFHAGRAAEPALGIAFIAAAADALNPGGRLLMVANRNLPYEQTLASRFRTFAVLEETGGYKIIDAVR